ncbi:MAG: DUF350 domain-containing protein [Alphaproteobacteria bacterium]
MMDFIYWDHSYNTTLLLNLLVVIALFTSIRLFTGTIAHINATDELLRKDNAAFGISVAGILFAITILLSGTVYGDPQDDMFDSAIRIALFGIVGIFLMGVTRFIFDKIAFPAISLHDEIVKGNVAVSIADTGNVIAAALIIRAVMVWITDNSLEGLLALLVGYAISQFILTIATFLRQKGFERRHPGRSIQQELKDNNIALALAFAGRKIGTAFAITVASQIVIYEIYNLVPILMAWFVVSVIVMVILKIVFTIAERIILFRVDTAHEIINQRNVAVGALQAVIYLSLGILLAEL